MKIIKVVNKGSWLLVATLFAIAVVFFITRENVHDYSLLNEQIEVKMSHAGGKIGIVATNILHDFGRTYPHYQHKDIWVYFQVQNKETFDLEIINVKGILTNTLQETYVFSRNYIRESWPGVEQGIVLKAGEVRSLGMFFQLPKKYERFSPGIWNDIEVEIETIPAKKEGMRVYRRWEEIEIYQAWSDNDDRLYGPFVVRGSIFGFDENYQKIFSEMALRNRYTSPFSVVIDIYDKDGQFLAVADGRISMHSNGIADFIACVWDLRYHPEADLQLRIFTEIGSPVLSPAECEN